MHTLVGFPVPLQQLIGTSLEALPPMKTSLTVLSQFSRLPIFLITSAILSQCTSTSTSFICAVSHDATKYRLSRSIMKAFQNKPLLTH